MKNKKKVVNKTIEVFNKIHYGHLENKNSIRRFQNLISADYLKEPKDFFDGKICIDVGCGLAGNRMYNLLSLGAKFVHGFDIKGNIISYFPTVLKRKRKNSTTGIN